MRHAAVPGRDNGAARDGGCAVIVEGAVAVARRTGDVDLAAGDGQITVGVDAVAARVDADGAAGDCNAAVGAAAEAVRPSTAEAALVGAARGVESVVTGDDVDRAAGNVNGLALDALVAFRDVERAVRDRDGLVRVHAVVAGRDGEGAAGDGHIAVCMHTIVRAVERVAAAADGDVGAGLDALGARVVGETGAAAAAGGDGAGGVKERERRLGLNAVLARREREHGRTDEDAAERTVTVVGGAQRVAAARHGHVRLLEHEAVLAVDAVVRCRDVHGRALDLQGVLARDAVVGIARHGERAAARDDEVALGVQAGVRLLISGGGEAVAVIIAAAVGEGAGRAVREIDEHIRRFIDIERAAVRARDVGVAQHERHVRARRVDEHASVRERTGEHVHAAVRDGHVVGPGEGDLSRVGQIRRGHICVVEPLRDGIVICIGIGAGAGGFPARAQYAYQQSRAQQHGQDALG